MKEAMERDTSSISWCFWLDRRKAVRIAVCLTTVLVLMSIYLSCTPCDSAWLSFNFLGSRPFLLPVQELPLQVQQEEEGPTTKFHAAIPPSPAPTTNMFVLSSNSSVFSASEEREQTGDSNFKNAVRAAAPMDEDDEMIDEDEVDSSQAFNSSQPSSSSRNEEKIESSNDNLKNVALASAAVPTDHKPEDEEEVELDSSPLFNSSRPSFSSESAENTENSNLENVGHASGPATVDDERKDEGEDAYEMQLDSPQVLYSSKNSTNRSSEVTEPNEDDSRMQIGSVLPPFVQPDAYDNNTLVDLQKMHPNSSQPELELLAAKLAIQGATMEDADPSLYGLVYNDLSAFSTSYKLMDKFFRVYVYKDGNSSVLRRGPLTGIYSSEGQFITKMVGSRFEEDDPGKAHMFFLPYSVAEMVLTLYVPGSHDMHPLNHFVTDYVNTIAQNYPFWNRSEGADHFFVSCHDWGPATARDQKQLRTNVVKVVCNANLSEEFVLGKDVSLPEIYTHHKPLKLGGPPPGSRALLAFFAGQMHGHVRPILIKHWKDKDPLMKIFEQSPPRNISGQMDYIQHMRNSKYCICPGGYEVNSPRIVEAIYYDCVPVIIADDFILPFSDVLDWTAFSVTVPEVEIPNLRDILLSIPDKTYRSMQKRLSKIRRHFKWHDKPLKYDAFHMILHSVWTSRLNRIHI